MSKFSVGDYITMDGLSGAFILQVMEVLDGGRYKTIVEESDIFGYTKGEPYFVAVEAAFHLLQEDLPEVVDTVFYTDNRCIKVETAAGGVGKVFLSVGGRNSGLVTGAHLDPDTALQIAHDLTRQAMEAKRRIKAEEE